jgi:hypothetical protein
MAHLLATTAIVLLRALTAFASIAHFHQLTPWIVALAGLGGVAFALVTRRLYAQRDRCSPGSCSTCASDGRWTPTSCRSSGRAAGDTAPDCHAPEPFRGTAPIGRSTASVFDP